MEIVLIIIGATILGGLSLYFRDKRKAQHEKRLADMRGFAEFYKAMQRGLGKTASMLAPSRDREHLEFIQQNTAHVEWAQTLLPQGSITSVPQGFEVMHPELRDKLGFAVGAEFHRWGGQVTSDMLEAMVLYHQFQIQQGLLLTRTKELVVAAPAAFQVKARLALEVQRLFQALDALATTPAAKKVLRLQLVDQLVALLNDTRATDHKFSYEQIHDIVFADFSDGIVEAPRTVRGRGTRRGQLPTGNDVIDPLGALDVDDAIFEPRKPPRTDDGPRS